MTDSKTSLVEQIILYVDAYLANQAANFKTLKSTLSVIMVLVDGKVEKNLFKDGKFESKIALVHVLGPVINMMMGRKTENAITNGFTTYAEQNNLNKDLLALKLFYDETGKLSYQVLYEDKPVNVDLIEFFNK